MDLQIYIDNSDHSDIILEDITQSVTESISTWIGELKKNIRLLSEIDTDIPENTKLGMQLQIKSKYKLKDPLNFLYSLAKEHKCEFVVALLNPDSGEAEDVCYFGFEEGRPDLFEIANYLEL